MADDHFGMVGKGTTSSSFLSLDRWNFSLRELILAILTIVLVLLALVLAAVFIGLTVQDVPVTGKNLCVSKSCLDTASRAIDFRNASVNPCDNFYQYACGNYKNVRPLLPGRVLRSPLEDLLHDNREKLEALLEQPVNRSSQRSSERKLKHLFQSCLDDYEREKLKGKPFLDKVVPALGGWNVLGNWDEDGWDFNKALRAVQNDFLVPAFAWITVTRHRDSRPSIDLMSADPGMMQAWYMHGNRAYQDFVRQIGALLLRDSGADLNEATKEDRLRQFVDDCFRVGDQIAILGGWWDGETGNDWNLLAPVEGNTETDIDWMDLLTSFFKGADVKEKAELSLVNRNYFLHINDNLRHLSNSISIRKRMLNNYLILRAAEVYSFDLSSEYRHAARRMLHDSYGGWLIDVMEEYCFYQSTILMRHALSSLYVRHFFHENNRQTTQDIARSVKAAMQNQMDATPWFNDAMKKSARDKLAKVEFHMGYPDWLENTDLVDKEFENIKIDASDFFGSSVNVFQYHREMFNRRLNGGDGIKDDWSINAFQTDLYVRVDFNLLGAPAGLLQFPFYESDQPHYSTFGALGGRLAEFLHRFIENVAGEDNKNYTKAIDCVEKLYVSRTDGYTMPDGAKIHVKPRDFGLRAVEQTNALRVAVKAYALWANEHRLAEKGLPGLGLTNQQTVFLSFAQSMCQNNSPQWYTYHVKKELSVNIMFGELEEFSEAFKCKVGDYMNHANRCLYF